MKRATAIVFALPLLAGCWAISDLSENRDLDHSLHYATEVEAGALSVRAPVVHLIDEKAKTGISLRSVDIGVVEPERYTAVRTNLAVFDATIARERKEASVFRQYDTVIKGVPATVYLMRFNQENSVKLVYMTFVGAPDDGVSVANSCHFFATAFAGEPWWDKPPAFFLRFAESVEIKRELNQTP